MITNLKQKKSKVRILFLFLTCGILLFEGVALSFAATMTPIVSGQNGPRGVALDEQNNYLYFVEHDGGTLNRIDISPGSTFPNSEFIVGGFSAPEDVALDVEGGFAYVTTKDLENHPPNTGALWKVDISTGSKTLRTFNLKAPKQLVLDLPNNQAYTVSSGDGKLRRIDLTTGSKNIIYTGLDQPVGLAITTDGQYAYVSEQGTNQISKIDLSLGSQVEVIASGLMTGPFFLAWTDSSEDSLYLVEQSPQKVSRIDLLTLEKYDVLNPMTSVTDIPSGIAVNAQGTSVYLSIGNEIRKYYLVDLEGPIFMGVGNVPASCIDEFGFATTNPGYFFKVKDSPFGGTLNIFANLSGFLAEGATHYAVLVQKETEAPEYLDHSWIMYKWNNSELRYDPVTVEPNTDIVNGVPLYEIPAQPQYWYPAFLFMRWPSGENGLYTFTVKLYKPNNNLIDTSDEQSLKIRVDNTPPTALINEIWQVVLPLENLDNDNPIETCEIVNTGDKRYYFNITAYDSEQHLLSYKLYAIWGNNQSATIFTDSYNNHVSAAPGYHWFGVINENIRDDDPWNAICDCAHTFCLRVKKRTTNGYGYILRRDYHQSITIYNTGNTCY